MRLLELSVPRLEPLGALDLKLRTPDGGLRVVATHLGRLAHEMKTSAEDLDAGRRHKATKALDRALHLAEFATSTFVLAAESARPFHDAHQAIKNARHELQMGRPEDTVRILAEAARALEGAPLPETSDPGLKPEHAAEVEGHRVLNARGHMLGEDASGDSGLGRRPPVPVYLRDRAPFTSVYPRVCACFTRMRVSIAKSHDQIVTVGPSLRELLISRLMGAAVISCDRKTPAMASASAVASQVRGTPDGVLCLQTRCCRS